MPDKAPTFIIDQLSESRSTPLTDKQKDFLSNYMDNGFDAKKAAIDAGYHKASWANVTRQLREELMTIAEMMLVSEAVPAASKISELMKANGNVPQANIKLEAAKTILDRTGLGKQEKIQHDHNVSGGIFILPAKEEITIEQE